MFVVCMFVAYVCIVLDLKLCAEVLIQLRFASTSGFMFPRYNGNLEQARKFGVQKGMINGGGMGFAYFTFFLCYALAFWYGSKLVREGEYTPGQMLIVSI